MKKAYLLFSSVPFVEFFLKKPTIANCNGALSKPNYIQAINILEHLDESDKQLFYLSKCCENISLEKSRDLKIYFIENFKNSIFIDDIHLP